MIDFIKAGIRLCLHHPDCRMSAVVMETPGHTAAPHSHYFQTFQHPLTLQDTHIEYSHLKNRLRPVTPIRKMDSIPGPSRQ